MCGISGIFHFDPRARVDESLLPRLNAAIAHRGPDDRRRRLLVYRDRLGEKPLYYTVAHDRLVFSSELKALIRDATTSRELSPEALSAYLTFQYNPARQTIFRDVMRLRPGTMLEAS